MSKEHKPTTTKTTKDSGNSVITEEQREEIARASRDAEELRSLYQRTPIEQLLSVKIGLIKL